MLVHREFDFMSNLPANTSYLRATHFFVFSLGVKSENSWAISFPKHCFDLLASKAPNVDLFLKSICISLLYTGSPTYYYFFFHPLLLFFTLIFCCLEKSDLRVQFMGLPKKPSFFLNLNFS